MEAMDFPRHWYHFLDWNWRSLIATTPLASSYEHHCNFSDRGHSFFNIHRLIQYQRRNSYPSSTSDLPHRTDSALTITHGAMTGNGRTKMERTKDKENITSWSTGEWSWFFVFFCRQVCLPVTMNPLVTWLAIWWNRLSDVETSAWGFVRRINGIWKVWCSVRMLWICSGCLLYR